MQRPARRPCPHPAAAVCWCCLHAAIVQVSQGRAAAGAAAFPVLAFPPPAPHPTAPSPLRAPPCLCPHTLQPPCDCLAPLLLAACACPRPCSCRLPPPARTSSASLPLPAVSVLKPSERSRSSRMVRLTVAVAVAVAVGGAVGGWAVHRHQDSSRGSRHVALGAPQHRRPPLTGAARRWVVVGRRPPQPRPRPRPPLADAHTRPTHIPRSCFTCARHDTSPAQPVRTPPTWVVVHDEDGHHLVAPGYQRVVQAIA